MSASSSLLSRLSHFLGGQLGIQVLNFVTGFLILRWLATEQYGQYSAVFAFQCVFAALVDLGMAGAIIALVGEDRLDKSKLGRVLRAAAAFRTRTFAALIGIAAIGFWFVTNNQPWPPLIKALLFGSIVASVWFQGPSTIHSTPLLIHNQLRTYYGVALSTGIVRLALCGALYFAGVLNGWVLSWIGAALIAASAGLYKRFSRAFVDESAPLEPQAQRDLWLYLKPLIVGLMFYAFQGQIAMLLITKFGSTLAVAQVGALGRLGQVLMVLEACNTVLFAPAIARASTKDLPRRYTQILIGALVAASSITVWAFLFPQTLLWLLGPRYANLGSEVGWIILTSALHFVASALWVMHSTRKMMRPWSSPFYFALTFGTQIVGAFVLDLSTTHGAVMLGVWTMTAMLVSNVVMGIVGWSYTRKETKVVSRIASRLVDESVPFPIGTWTTQPPTAPGFYWFRARGTEHPTVVMVKFINGVSGELCVLRFRESKPIRLRQSHQPGDCWAGPIVFPDEK